MENQDALDLILKAIVNGWGWADIDPRGELREHLRAMKIEPGPEPEDGPGVVTTL